MKSSRADPYLGYGLDPVGLGQDLHLVLLRLGGSPDLGGQLPLSPGDGDGKRI
jgi:hypothetical protein